MRCHICQRPMSSKGPSHLPWTFRTDSGSERYTAFSPSSLRVDSGAGRSKEREGERERESFYRREATLSSSWPDDDESTGHSPEPRLP